MIIRQAKTSDLPTLVPMFVALLDYLKRINPSLDYAKDRDKLIGGCLETLRGKMVTSGHIVLVAEDEGRVIGFCSGCLLNMPSFFKNSLVGSCEWLYPLNVTATKPLVEYFDRWAVYNGATGRQGYTPDGSHSEKVMVRNGMRPQTTTYFREYFKE